jgi:hypothetical protein
MPTLDEWFIAFLFYDTLTKILFFYLGYKIIIINLMKSKFGKIFLKGMIKPKRSWFNKKDG